MARRYSREARYTHAFASFSAKNLQEYSEKHGMSVSSLTNWRKEARRAGLMEPTAHGRAPSDGDMKGRCLPQKPRPLLKPKAKARHLADNPSGALVEVRKLIEDNADLRARLAESERNFAELSEAANEILALIDSQDETTADRK